MTILLIKTSKNNSKLNEHTMLDSCIFFKIIRKDIEEIIILGDIVGYGANPNECIKVCKRIS